MKKIFITIFSIAACTTMYAQSFVAKGKIEYEKKVNLHANLENDSWTQMIMKTVPKFKTTYFDLYFDNGKTVYKPGKDVIEPVKIPDWLLGPANDNTVFTDLEKQSVVAQKTVFDGTYLLTDSTRKVDWKITNDTRTIAGIECRKATTIIMDSIFVVAFYSDQILVNGGPESFNGLPGMILGLAIPRLHATWYATKVELIQVKETDLAVPSKGKKINKTELNSKLAAAMKDWGKEGTRNIWQVML